MLSSFFGITLEPSTLFVKQDRGVLMFICVLLGLPFSSAFLAWLTFIFEAELSFSSFSLSSLLFCVLMEYTWVLSKASFLKISSYLHTFLGLITPFFPSLLSSENKVQWFYLSSLAELLGISCENWRLLKVKRNFSMIWNKYYNILTSTQPL